MATASETFQNWQSRQAPQVNALGVLLALADQKMKERQQAERDQRLAEQDWRRDERHSQAQHENALAELMARDKLRQEELGRRNVAIQSNLDELNSLEVALGDHLAADENRKRQAIASAATASMFANHPELGALRKIGVSDFSNLAAQIGDEKLRSKLLAEYGYEVERLAQKPTQFESMPANAKTAAMMGRIKQLNEAIGRHVELGGTLPKGMNVGVISQPGADWTLPPLPSVPARTATANPAPSRADLGAIAGPPSPAPRSPYGRTEGAIPSVLGKTRNSVADLGALIEAATQSPRNRAKNAWTWLFGGDYAPTGDAALSPEQKAILENSRILGQPAAYGPAVGAVAGPGFVPPPTVNSEQDRHLELGGVPRVVPIPGTTGEEFTLPTRIPGFRGVPSVPSLPLELVPMGWGE